MKVPETPIEKYFGVLKSDSEVLEDVEKCLEMRKHAKVML